MELFPGDSRPVAGHAESGSRTGARAAACQENVNLHGATGAGKERVARTLPERSRRRERPFVPLNPRLSAHLFEAQLVGPLRGSCADRPNPLEDRALRTTTAAVPGLSPRVPTARGGARARLDPRRIRR